jgi:hypothetical protein
MRRRATHRSNPVFEVPLQLHVCVVRRDTGWLSASRSPLSTDVAGHRGDHSRSMLRCAPHLPALRSGWRCAAPSGAACWPSLARFSETEGGGKAITEQFFLHTGDGGDSIIPPLTSEWGVWLGIQRLRGKYSTHSMTVWLQSALVAPDVYLGAGGLHLPASVPRYSGQTAQAVVAPSLDRHSDGWPSRRPTTDPRVLIVKRAHGSFGIAA